MTRRVRCPRCGAAVEFDAAAARADCSACGAGLRVAAKPAAAEPTFAPGEEEPAPAEPPRKKRKKKRKPAPAARTPWPLIGGGVAGLALAAGLLVWLLSGDAPRPAKGDGAAAPAEPAAEPTPAEPAVAWRLPDGGRGPRASLPPFLRLPDLPAPAGARSRHYQSARPPVMVRENGGRYDYLAVAVTLATEGGGQRNELVRGVLDPAAGTFTEVGPLELYPPRPLGPKELASPHRFGLIQYGDGKLEMPAHGLPKYPAWDVAADGTLAFWDADPTDFRPLHASEARQGGFAAGRGTIRLWPAGAAGPAAVTIPVESWLPWLGFTESGKLLVLQNATFSVWDPATGQKLRDLPGNYPIIPDAAATSYPDTWTPTLSPRRNYLVVRRGEGGGDFLHPDTGELLARVADDRPWLRIALTAAAGRVSAVRGAKPGEELGGSDLRHWDLHTGKEVFQPAVNFPGAMKLLDAGGDRLIAAVYPNGRDEQWLIDARAGVPQGKLAFKLAPSESFGQGLRVWGLIEPLDDAGPWWVCSTGFVRGNIPEQSVTGDRVGPGQVVRIVERPADRPDWTGPLRDELAAGVARRGAAPGDGGWAVTVAVEDLGGSGVIETGSGTGVPIPHLRATVTFRSPAGATDATSVEAGFGHEKSPYFVRTQKFLSPYVMPRPGELISKTYYNFGGKDPGKAMTEEAAGNLRKWVALLPFPTLLAGGAGTRPGVLPAVEIDFPDEMLPPKPKVRPLNDR